jgi:hypothetical protein
MSSIFNGAPIRCGRTRCKWRGYMSGLNAVDVPGSGLKMRQYVCPICGCDCYSVMTAGEIKAWERSKQKAEGATA